MNPEFLEFGTGKITRAVLYSRIMKKFTLSLCVGLALLADVEAAGLRTVLFPIRSAVLSSLVDSRIAEIPVAEGTAFRASATLLVLESEPFRLRAARARAALSEAASGARFAEKNVKRIRELYEKRGFQSLQELERAQAEMEQARAREAMAVEALKLAEFDFANCRVAAPYAGRLVRRMAQPGEYVRVGQNVLQILDDSRMYAVLHLDSARRLKLRTGDEFSVRIDETARVYRGKVAEIAADIDPASRTFTVKLELDNADGLLVAGMSGVLLETEAPAK